MASLTELQRWRDELQDARFKGIRSVQDSNGERIEYKSDSEMSRALASIDSEIARLQRARVSIIKIQSSKGV